MSVVEIALLCGLALALVAVVALLARTRALGERIATLEARSPVGEGDLAALRHASGQVLFFE